MRELSDDNISNDLGPDKVQRVALEIAGRVQGVGFRPFVYHLACRLMLHGFIKNAHDSVYVEVQGWSQSVRRFVEAIRSRPPAMAKIERFDWKNIKPEAVDLRQAKFQIDSSTDSDGKKTFLPADLATCEDCLRELVDPSNRRYHYPLISCVNCGPRFTVLEALPYDRERTSMKTFPLCDQCEAEFTDPSDRRFHAQTIACQACGPKVLNDDSDEMPSWVVNAAQRLKLGQCIAMKGIGGFHLVCDAGNPAAVRQVRQRKHRDEKPLAIMVRDLDAALELCEISEEEKRLLTSSARPVVLLRRRHLDGETSDLKICGEVSCSSPFLGILLPYTPMQYLLLQAVGGAALVMTSANESGLPMSYEDSAPGLALGALADAVVTHDRRIEIRCDDSVMRVADPDGLALLTFIRRSRGFAPEPIRLRFETDVPLLALGAQLKNTFGLGVGSQAIISHYIGDLDEMATYESYRSSIDQYERIMAFSPQILVHDQHPDYLSTRYAMERSRRSGIRLLGVQHHHAHIASCMADNGLPQGQNVMGVAFDGTGFGLDGKVWGGEFFVGSYEGFERVGHLAYVPMPGGEQAIREPWRMAQAYLTHSGYEWSFEKLGISAQTQRMIRQMMDRGLNCPMTSSVGRLFDAVAALLGLRLRVSYEGQAAVELEALALRSTFRSHQGYFMPILSGNSNEPFQIDAAPMMGEILSDIKRGVHGSEIAGRFHQSLIQMLTRVCEELRRARGLNHVALSGGVFMNGILLSGAVHSLKERDFQVFFHRQVPPNDGGISLGQLAIAAARLKTENDHVFGNSRKARRDLRRE